MWLKKCLRCLHCPMSDLRQVHGKTYPTDQSTNPFIAKGRKKNHISALGKRITPSHYRITCSARITSYPSRRFSGPGNSRSPSIYIYTHDCNIVIIVGRNRVMLLRRNETPRRRAECTLNAQPLNTHRYRLCVMCAWKESTPPRG